MRPFRAPLGGFFPRVETVVNKKRLRGGSNRTRCASLSVISQTPSLEVAYEGLHTAVSPTAHQRGLSAGKVDKSVRKKNGSEEEKERKWSIP